MQKESPVAVLSTISRGALGVFRGRQAVDAGVSRNRLTLLRRQGVIEHVRLEGVRADVPEIVLTTKTRAPSNRIVVHHGERLALMVLRVRGISVTGAECTLLRLAAELDDEAFEIAAFEDARRRRLTSIPAVEAYLGRFARPGRPGCNP